MCKPWNLAEIKGVIDMKYFVMLCDGMADEPVEALGNKTPMEKAVKPCMDSLAAKGEV